MASGDKTVALMQNKSNGTWNIGGGGSGLDADLWTGISRDTLVASLRANVKIDGGRVITWDSNKYFNSSYLFRIMSNGGGTFFSTDNHFDISIPVSGTIQGVGGAASVTATSAGVPISDFQALYYILPIGKNHASIESNFRIVSYTSDVVIPDNWVLIAANNRDTNTLTVAGGKYILHPGESIDTTKYSSAFVPNADTVRGLPADFTSSKATNGYQKLPSELIIQWGHINTGTSDSNISVTFPIAFPSLCSSVYISADTVGSSDGRVPRTNNKSVSGFTRTQDSFATPRDSNYTEFWIAIGY